MKDDDTISLRSFFGFVAMIVGALLGWGLAELFWRQTHIHGIGHWARPMRGWGYLLIAALCSMSLSALGLALVRFRDLPSGDGDDSGKDSLH